MRSRDTGSRRFDMVVVNLYQFEKFAAKPDVTREELIENIDIGGPTMIRAAAKNFQDVAVVVSPDSTTTIARELETNGGSLSAPTPIGVSRRKHLRTPRPMISAVAARLARIDARADASEPDCCRQTCISRAHARCCPSLRRKSASAGRALQLRATAGIAGAEQLHGKELSYNNLVDLDAAWQLIQEFEHPAAAIIKHTNPCGCAEQDDSRRSLSEGVRSRSGFGVRRRAGVQPRSGRRDGARSRQAFVEAIAAPAFSQRRCDVLHSEEEPAAGAGRPAIGPKPS